MLMAASVAKAKDKVRWPRDAFEIEKIEAAKAKAVEEGDGVAVIFAPSQWPDDEDGSIARTIEVVEDAIKALKSFCVIVNGAEVQVFLQMQAQNKDEQLKVLTEGVQKAGNSYPIVVVLDAEMKQVVLATSGQVIHKEGKSIFRDAKKKLRELEKAREEEK